MIVAIQSYVPGSVMIDHPSLNEGIKPDLFSDHTTELILVLWSGENSGGLFLPGREYLIECWTPSDRRRFYYTCCKFVHYFHFVGIVLLEA